MSAENCCDCLLINQTDFEGVVPRLAEDIDSDELLISIRETKFLITKYICPALYESLCEEELSVVDEGLLCKIRAVWVRYAYADFLFSHPLSITKQGVVRKFSDESENLEASVIEKHSNAWRMKAQNYIEAMLDYLTENQELNPLYKGCDGCKTKQAGAVGLPYSGIF